MGINLNDTFHSTFHFIRDDFSAYTIIPGIWFPYGNSKSWAISTVGKLEQINNKFNSIIIPFSPIKKTKNNTKQHELKTKKKKERKQMNLKY